MSKNYSEMQVAVYCGTYAKYNDGSIAGAWVDLEEFSDKDELYGYLRELHKDEEDPEFMFQDFEGFPKAWYGESGCEWDKIFEWLELDADDRERVAEYIDEVDSSADVWEVSRKSYYPMMSDEDFGYEMMVDASGVPDYIMRYFDYERFGRDCKMDYTLSSNYIWLE